MKPQIDVLTLISDMPIQGDLTKETWPKYLPRNEVRFAMCEIIRHQVPRMKMDRFRRGQEQHCFYLVGESYWSRMIAISEEGPVGVVYILKDDGEPFPNHTKPLTFVVEKVITLGDLIQDSFVSIKRHLEADKHLNNRLE